MKGSTDWVDILENAFKNMDLKLKDFHLNELLTSKNIMTYRMGEVLIWNENSLSLYCINIKSSSENFSPKCYQELVWNNRPSFEISKICLSPTETQVALYGSRGVQVVTMPTSRGSSGLSSDAIDSITCSCHTLDEKHFLVSGERILCCKWHPGFSTPNVLVVLSSENFFRIYRSDAPLEPFQVIDLNSPLVSSKNVLGESYISFDFSRERQVPSFSVCVEDQPELYWIAYLLVGNGQVCSCSVFFDAKNSFKHSIQGPLGMFPPAEDNYGCDACSILYVNSSPPTLVVATSEGKLHHCVILNSEAADSATGLGRDRPEEQALYVCETVQLELSLKTAPLDASLISSSSEDDFDPFISPMHLYIDPILKQRYHCCHTSGLHTIYIPWLTKLEEYFAGDEVKLNHLERDDHCIVEHLLCTKPLSSSSITPIIGFAQVEDVVLGSKVICLTADHKINIFPLLQSYKTQKLPLALENSSDVGLKQLKQSGDFSDKIGKILQKKSMNPFIKGSLPTSNQESFKLLCRATQVFREEYIQKYEQVQVEIEKNVFRLKKMKSRQEVEVKQLSQEYSNIRDKQKQMLDKIVMIVKKQEVLKNKLNSIGLKVEISIPILSEAEEKMVKTLKNFQNAVDGYDKSIHQLTRKSEHCQKEMTKSSSSSKVASNMSEDKANSIHTLLRKEGEEINLLKKSLKTIQSNLNL